ncbi:MAG: PAS domain S-box protein [Deltaproteobacteria bacterium]|nr:PAS domain S-box protein [Deltaproteobacteria bacterium]
MMEEHKGLKVAIVGGGNGCKAIMDMIFAETLRQLHMEIIAVADINSKAPGYRYAQENGIYTTMDYRDLYKIKNLNMILELTGRDDVANEISRNKPEHIRLMDHITARVFWDVFEIEEERLADEKRAEETLRQSEERYRTVLVASPDPVVVYDMKGRVTYINSAFTRIFGWISDELEGKKLHYIPDENWPETQMMIDKVLAGENFSTIESRRYTKERNIIDVSISTAVYLDRKGNPAGSIHTLRDITARKQSQEMLKKARDELEQHVKERTAELMIVNEQLRREIEEKKRVEKGLKASEEKYRVLFNYDPNCLFMVEMDSAKILDLNKAATKAYEYDREELLEMSLFDLLDKEDAQRLKKELGHLVKEGDYMFVPRLWARRKEDNHFYIDFHARVGKFRERERGSLGLSLIVRTVDITLGLERQAQLVQASKMATLGEMATGMAHELNQPLNVMRMGADFIAKMIRRGQEISDEQLMTVSRNISGQVERATKIINHLREFGRKGDFRVYPVDLNQPIKDLFTIIGEQLRLQDIEVKLEMDKAIPKIMADRNRLEQIFLNLVTNAMDAMKKRGTEDVKKITVTTYLEGDLVVAEVSDTGKGISERIGEKIFEPFFTTKDVGRGTGLGLSITYGLVRDFKGGIDVESILDVSTTFRVRFPAYKEKRKSE